MSLAAVRARRPTQMLCPAAVLQRMLGREPIEGIQPNIAHEIGDVIERLNLESNLTVLLVEQQLPIARRVATE